MQTVTFPAALTASEQNTKGTLDFLHGVNSSPSAMRQRRNLLARWIVLLMTLILLIMGAEPAFASTTSANVTPNASSIQNGIPTSYSIPNTSNLLSVVGSVNVAAIQMANRFIPYAKGITVLLGAIGIVWTGIIVILSSADIWGNVLRPMFITAITTGFALLILFDYSIFAPMIVDGFIDAGQILVGIPAGQNHSELGSMLGMSSVTSIEVLKNMARQFQFSQYPSTWDALLAIPGMICNFVLDFFTAIPMYFFFLLDYVIFLVVYLAFQFAIGVAVAVGPVFIPFLVLPITKSLFDGWFKMLIISGLYMMTSTVIMGLLFSMSVAMSADLTVNMNSPAGVADHFGQMLLMLVFGLFSILALFETHSFAHAIGGSVNLGGMNAAGKAAKVASGAL